MTNSQSFDEQRRAVLQSHLQIALTEGAELEAMLERLDSKLAEAYSAGELTGDTLLTLRRVIEESNGHTLKEHDKRVRRAAFIEAASLVAGVVDDQLLRADNDHADAARSAFDKALREAHERLLNVAKLSDDA